MTGSKEDVIKMLVERLKYVPTSLIRCLLRYEQQNPNELDSIDFAINGLATGHFVVRAWNKDQTKLLGLIEPGYAERDPGFKKANLKKRIMAAWVMQLWDFRDVDIVYVPDFPYIQLTFTVLPENDAGDDESDTFRCDSYDVSVFSINDLQTASFALCAQYWSTFLCLDDYPVGSKKKKADNKTPLCDLSRDLHLYHIAYLDLGPSTTVEALSKAKTFQRMENAGFTHVAFTLSGRMPDVELHDIREFTGSL